MLSEHCNTLVLRPRLFLNSKFFSIGIGIVIEFSKLRYWYLYWYWFSKSGVLILILVSISEIWNIDIDIGIETWSSTIKYWYCLIQAGIAHLWFRLSTKSGIDTKKLVKWGEMHFNGYFMSENLNFNENITEIVNFCVETLTYFQSLSYF